jgi:CRP-like cAMP-binding protein
MVTKYSEIFFSRFGGPIFAARLVSGLSEPDRQGLGKIMQTRHYEKGQTIFARDSIPAEILFVKKGNAELECGDQAGRTREVAVGEVIGLTEALAEAKYCDTLTAKTDCEMSVISRDDLIWYLRNTPEACYRSLEVVAENLHTAGELAIGDY